MGHEEIDWDPEDDKIVMEIWADMRREWEEKKATLRAEHPDMPEKELLDLVNQRS